MIADLKKIQFSDLEESMMLLRFRRFPSFNQTILFSEWTQSFEKRILDKQLHDFIFKKR